MIKKVLLVLILMFSMVNICAHTTDIYAYTEEEKQQAKSWLSSHGYPPTRAGAEQAYQDYLDGKLDIPEADAYFGRDDDNNESETNTSSKNSESKKSTSNQKSSGQSSAKNTGTSQKTTEKKNTEKSESSSEEETKQDSQKTEQKKKKQQKKNMTGIVIACAAVIIFAGLVLLMRRNM